MSQNWKITIEYDGSAYFGWQRQEHVPSIQQAIEEAILGFTQENIVIHGAGRTDSGVHALGQVATFKCQKDFSSKTIRDAINAHLRDANHKGIIIREALAVPDEFHARFSATYRSYCYRLLTEKPTRSALFPNHFWKIHTPLNLKAMKEASQHLIGKHDFTSFRASACQAKSPLKSLDKITFNAIESHPFYTGNLIDISVEARSFLHHQVRNIVGMLVDIGQEKYAPEHVKQVLEAKDRTKAGITAPAQGLYFMRVDY